MPFTPTHILAILPIAAVKRSPLPFSALVIGSMIPDLPLFIPLLPGYRTTHSIAGLFTACLPLGLFCFLLFQLLMKRPLFALLPEAIQCRCVSFSMPCIEPAAKTLAYAALAIVLGASTHVFWDSFTHRGRWGTQFFPRLNEPAMTIGDHAIPGFKLLQYGSTVVGLPSILLVLAIWLYRRKPEPLGGKQLFSASSKITAYLIAIAIPVAVTLFVWYREDVPRYNQVGRSITTSGLVLMIAALVYCFAFHVVQERMTRAKRR